jgi:hypothetical protein
MVPAGTAGLAVLSMIGPTKMASLFLIACMSVLAALIASGVAPAPNGLDRT